MRHFHLCTSINNATGTMQCNRFNDIEFNRRFVLCIRVLWIGGGISNDALSLI